jgi:hypothetical protein
MPNQSFLPGRPGEECERKVREKYSGLSAMVATSLLNGNTSGTSCDSVDLHKEAGFQMENSGRRACNGGQPLERGKTTAFTRLKSLREGAR